MSDLTKVVQKLSETNLRLGRLEEQNAESNTAASIIAQSLPEVLSDRNVASNREKLDKDQRITETDDNVRDNTKILGKKIDKLNMKSKKDGDPNFIGPPTAPSNTGAGEEDEKDRMKLLAGAITKSPIGKGILSISKSIGGFIKGMASTVTGGAMMFLKGIIGASALGLIIMFLKSDVFKEFLSKENLMKLRDGFIYIGKKFKELLFWIADPDNKTSLYSILGGAAFVGLGGLSLIGGTLSLLGGLFGVKGIFGSKAITSAENGIASSKKGGGKFMKFLKAGALIGLAISAFDGITAAQDSYMKGNPFGKIVADSVGGIVKSLTFGIIDAQKISEFLSPSDSIKVFKKEGEIRLLEKSIDADGTTPQIKILKEKKIEQLKSELETFKKDSQKRADLKVKKQDERSAQEEFDIKRKKFIAEGTAIDRLLGKGKSMSQRRKEGIITSGNFAQIKYGKKFDEKFGKENPQLKLDAIENLEKKKIKELKVIKKNEDEQKMLDLLAKKKQENVELLGGRTNTFGGATINNTTIVNQKGGDSKIENKQIFSKPATNLSFHEVYVNSY